LPAGDRLHLAAGLYPTGGLPLAAFEKIRFASAGIVL
jgi:hypothetical protein